MLETALQMARSLGPEGAGGNAALGSWLGEKYEGVLPLCHPLIVLPSTKED